MAKRLITLCDEEWMIRRMPWTQAFSRMLNLFSFNTDKPEWVLADLYDFDVDSPMTLDPQQNPQHRLYTTVVGVIHKFMAQSGLPATPSTTQKRSRDSTQHAAADTEEDKTQEGRKAGTPQRKEQGRSESPPPAPKKTKSRGEDTKMPYLGPSPAAAIRELKPAAASLSSSLVDRLNNFLLANKAKLDEALEETNMFTEVITEANGEQSLLTRIIAIDQETGLRLYKNTCRVAVGAWINKNSNLPRAWVRGCESMENLRTFQRSFGRFNCGFDHNERQPWPDVHFDITLPEHEHLLPLKSPRGYDQGREQAQAGPSSHNSISGPMTGETTALLPSYDRRDHGDEERENAEGAIGYMRRMNALHIDNQSEIEKVLYGTTMSARIYINPKSGLPRMVFSHTPKRRPSVTNLCTREVGKWINRNSLTPRQWVRGCGCDPSCVLNHDRGSWPNVSFKIRYPDILLKLPTKPRVCNRGDEEPPAPDHPTAEGGSSSFLQQNLVGP